MSGASKAGGLISTAALPSPWPPTEAVAVAWDEPWPLGGPDSLEYADMECRVSVADAIRIQRAAMAETAAGRQFAAAMTDAELLGDFVAVHWARFVGADGRLVEDGESAGIMISTAAE